MTITEIGNIIRQRREYLLLKQEDLSELSGLSIRTIYQIENGSNPSAKTLEKILEVLGLELTIQVKKTD